MSKLVISKLFLYRYRFIIGYIVLGLAFIALIFLLPLISPAGLSDLERQSVVGSYNLHFSSITSGDLVDLPYHILQKLSILLFGLTPYAIKLPSILVGLVLGLLLILLLNRWFKSNVALLASILTVLSTPFLYLANYARLLAHAPALAWVKNPGRKTAQAPLVLRFRPRAPACHLHPTPHLPRRLHHLLHPLESAPTLHRQISTQNPAHWHGYHPPRRPRHLDY